jgi:cytochrome P450
MGHFLLLVDCTTSLRDLRVHHNSIIQQTVERVARKWSAKGTFDVFEFGSELLSTANVQALLGVNDEAFITKIPIADTLERDGLTFWSIFAPWLPFGPPEHCRKVRSSIQADTAKLMPSIRAKDTIDSYAGYLASLNKYPDDEIVRRTFAVFVGARKDLLILKSISYSIINYSFFDRYQLHHYSFMGTCAYCQAQHYS